MCSMVCSNCKAKGRLQAALVTSSETELCFSNQGVEFTLEQEAQGGRDSIQWEMFDGGVWSPLDSAVIADPLPEGVNEFRFVSFTQCGIATSDVIEVVVYPEVNAPEIALLSSDTLCNENTGAQIQIAVPASGGSPSNDATWSLNSIEGDSSCSATVRRPWIWNRCRRPLNSSYKMSMLAE